jgi:hypothetical protein
LSFFDWVVVIFFDVKWTKVLFGYMPISKVPYVIENKTEMEKNEVVKTKRAKRYLILIFNSKLSVNLKFYKSFRSIKVISPILPSDLMPNPNGWGYCIKLEVRWVKLRVFKRSGSFRNE